MRACSQAPRNARRRGVGRKGEKRGQSRSYFPRALNLRAGAAISHFWQKLSRKHLRGKAQVSRCAGMRPRGA